MLCLASFKVSGSNLRLFEEYDLVLFTKSIYRKHNRSGKSFHIDTDCPKLMSAVAQSKDYKSIREGWVRRVHDSDSESSTSTSNSSSLKMKIINITKSTAS